MMEDDNRVLSNVIKIDDERIKGHLDRVVRGTVEETLNALLDAAADACARCLKRLPTSCSHATNLC